MRHPFWRWAGWLSIGLSGCLHGQDWRAAVTNPTTRPVADQRESRPQPKVVGPFRGGQPKFVPPAEVSNAPAIAVRPATPSRVPQFPKEVTLSPASKPEPRVRTQQVTPAGHEVPQTALATSQKVAPAVSAETSQVVSPKETAAPPVVVESPRTEPFAEFERTIPSRHPVVVKPAVPPAKPVEVVVEESEPEQPAPLPVITPAGAIVAAKPMEIQPSRSRSLEPDVPSSDERPRGLFSKSAVLAKELPDVTDTTAATAKDSPDVDAETSVRPQDVSVLVEQVFEDLRQRRMDDARQRTEWLKQLVRKRAPASSANGVEDGASMETSENHSGEPRRLNVDPQATAVEKAVPETFFDDEESTSRK